MSVWEVGVAHLGVMTLRSSHASPVARSSTTPTQWLCWKVASHHLKGSTTRLFSSRSTNNYSTDSNYQTEPWQCASLSAGTTSSPSRRRPDRARELIPRSLLVQVDDALSVTVAKASESVSSSVRGLRIAHVRSLLLHLLGPNLRRPS